MAAIHSLDVSMALDDLGWHFFNERHRGLCEETRLGLRELEAIEAADIFEAACAIVFPQWDEIVALSLQDADEFVKWYGESGLEGKLHPLNLRLWAICEARKLGLLGYWLDYARKYPERVVAASRT